MEAKIYYGRGGWTWYTGSSSWYYKCGIEDILGMKIRNNNITIDPCIPNEWKEYSIQYKHEETIYNIKVKNINHNEQGQRFILNGVEQSTKQVKLENNGKINEIEVII